MVGNLFILIIFWILVCIFFWYFGFVDINSIVYCKVFEMVLNLVLINFCMVIRMCLLVSFMESFFFLLILFVIWISVFVMFWMFILLNVFRCFWCFFRLNLFMVFSIFMNLLKDCFVKCCIYGMMFIGFLVLVKVINLLLFFMSCMKLGLFFLYFFLKYKVYIMFLMER